MFSLKMKQSYLFVLCMGNTMQALSAFAIEVFSTVFPTNKFFSKLNTVTQIALGQTLAIYGLKKFWVYLNCKKSSAEFSTEFFSP